MARMVLDSWTLLAFFEDEPAAEKVEAILLDGENGKHHLFLCALDWCEIFTSIMSRVSQQAAEEKARQISELPIELVVVGNDLALIRQASIYRATHGLTSACAFTAALAKTRKASLVTGDPIFRVLEDQFKIQWLA
jgi:predicted nucleic acid-binding protein